MFLFSFFNIIGLERRDWMNFLQQMNNSLDYIEQHMDQKIDIEKIAQIAYTSKFHYQRMFNLLTGYTVLEYIRKRRLTLAAQELSTNDIKVIDIALKYGYETPESFSRAFTKLHGISPSKVKQNDVNLIAFPKLSFQIYLKGEKAMDYRIVEKESFKVIGLKREITTENGENFNIIPRFWTEVRDNGELDRLDSYSNQDVCYGICMDFKLEEEKFNYYIAVDKQDKAIPEGFEEREIPQSTWAVFKCVGALPESIQETSKRIYQEWFPASIYEHDNKPEIEVYLPGDLDSPKYTAEIWVPIIKK